VFETIGNHSERKGLRSCLRVPGVVTIGENARQFSYLGNPPAVFLLLEFHAEHNHNFIVIQDVVCMPWPKFELPAAGIVSFDPGVTPRKSWSGKLHRDKKKT
jgi:hypothetical protein